MMRPTPTIEQVEAFFDPYIVAADGVYAAPLWVEAILTAMVNELPAFMRLHPDLTMHAALKNLAIQAFFLGAHAEREGWDTDRRGVEGR